MEIRSRALQTRRAVLTLVLTCAAVACLGVEKPQRPPKSDEGLRRVTVMESWRKQRWSAEEMLALLKRHPNLVLSLGKLLGGPTGIPARRWPELPKVLRQLQDLAAREGFSLDGRLLVSYRIYVHRPYQPGWRTCHPHCSWEGTAQDDPFDVDWIARVPRAHHLKMVERNLACDPFGERADGCWARHVDAERIRLLATKDSVPALYGSHKSANGVLLDVRKPELRQWMYRRLVRQLKSIGVKPGGPVVIVELTVKPGWLVHYRDAAVDTGDPCWEPGSHMWTGPAKVCAPRCGKNGECNAFSPGGPLHYVGRYLYGPGEYEAVYNLQIRETKQALEAAGYEGALISTVERPVYGGRPQGVWATLEPATRELRYLVGERRNFRGAAAASGKLPRGRSGSHRGARSK